MDVMKKLLYHTCVVLLVVGGLSNSAMSQDSARLIRNRGVLTTPQTHPPQTHPPTTANSSADLAGVSRSSAGEQAAFGTFPSLMPTAGHADTGTATDPATAAGASPLITVTSSLAVVLGLFAALIWATRRFGGRAGGNGTIPKDIFQNLGSTSIDPRTQISLLRCGQRILIIARTNNGVHRLGEITGPEEVNQLTAACLGDSKQAFQTALQSMESEPTDGGYLGQQANQPTARSRGRLFANA